MARLMADAASKEGAREALVAGLNDDVPHIRGTCALLLLQSGEPAESKLLQALVGTFAYPDSETGRAARELMASLLASPATREAAREALVAGLSDDVPGIHTVCDQLLQALG